MWWGFCQDQKLDFKVHLQNLKPKASSREKKSFCNKSPPTRVAPILEFSKCLNLIDHVVGHLSRPKIGLGKYTCKI